MKILKIKTNTNHFNRVFQNFRSSDPFHPCTHHILWPISPGYEKKMVFAKPFFFTRESKETFDFPFLLPPTVLLMSLWLIHTIYDMLSLSCEESPIKSCNDGWYLPAVAKSVVHFSIITGLRRFLRGMDPH